MDPGRCAGGLRQHALPVLPRGRVGNVERPEHGGLGGALRQRVCERVHQHREAERVGPEDELLAALVGDVAGGREHPDRLLPLSLCQSHLGGELVQMSSERLHDLAQPGVLAALEAGEHGRRDVRGSGARHAASPGASTPSSSESK